MGLPRQHLLHEFPYAGSREEERYYQRVHYFASALFVFGAGDDVLRAMGKVWEQVMARAGEALQRADSVVHADPGADRVEGTHDGEGVGQGYQR
jgi:hypothetical protein